MRLQKSDFVLFGIISRVMREPGVDYVVNREGLTDEQVEAVWYRCIELLRRLGCADQFRIGCNGATKIHYIRFEP